MIRLWHMGRPELICSPFQKKKKNLRNIISCVNESHSVCFKPLIHFCKWYLPFSKYAGSHLVDTKMSYSLIATYQSISAALESDMYLHFYFKHRVKFQFWLIQEGLLVISCKPHRDSAGRNDKRISLHSAIYNHVTHAENLFGSDSPIQLLQKNSSLYSHFCHGSFGHRYQGMHGYLLYLLLWNSF